MGTTGTVIVDRDGYEIYDLKGKKTSEFKAGGATSSADLVGRDSMTTSILRISLRGFARKETERAD